MAIRVAHVITDLHSGGAETMLLKLLSRTDRRRLEPFVIALKDGGRIQESIRALGVPVHTLGMRLGLHSPFRVWRLVRALREFRPDLVQGWMVHGNLAAQIATSFVRKTTPVLWNIRHSARDLRDFGWRTICLIRLMAPVSRRAARVLYNSRESVAEHKALGYASENAVFLPNGFECDLFRPDPSACRSVRNELGVPDEAILIGLSARYHPMKGHQEFCAAAAEITALKPDVHFLLFGYGADQSNAGLVTLITRLNLQNKVHLLGDRTDTPRLTAALDIANSTSYCEAFSNSIGEAMSCGVPCVATDVGASAWILGGTGRVVPPGDSAALATAWREWIELSRVGRQQLGAAARARVVAEFSIERVASEYEKLYLEVLHFVS